MDKAIDTPTLRLGEHFSLSKARLSTPAFAGAGLCYRFLVIDVLFMVSVVAKCDFVC